MQLVKPCALLSICTLLLSALPARVLRFRYEEGPASDSDGSGLEVKIVKECGFGAAWGVHRPTTCRLPPLKACL